MRNHNTEQRLRRQVPARLLLGLLPAGLIVFLALGAAPAWALTTISIDTTITTNHPAGDYLVVGTATLTVSGGTINGSVTTANSSTLNLDYSAVVVGNVVAGDTSTVTVSNTGG